MRTIHSPSTQRARFWRTRASKSEPASSPGDLAELLQRELDRVRAPRLRRVINATGVIVHTNLGRAPLAEAALAQVAAAARGYSNLEYDLARRRARLAPDTRRCDLARG